MTTPFKASLQYNETPSTYARANPIVNDTENKEPVNFLSCGWLISAVYTGAHCVHIPLAYPINKRPVYSMGILYPKRVIKRPASITTLAVCNVIFRPRYLV